MKAKLITKFGECFISSLEIKDTVINLYFCFDCLHFDGIYYPIQIKKPILHKVEIGFSIYLNFNSLSSPMNTP